MGYIQNFREIDRTAVSIVGGKGASLGELWRLVPLRGNTSAADVDVPDGFCVTTDAYRTVLSELPCVDDLLERLAKAEPDDIAALSTQIRTAIEECTIPGDIAEEIAARVRELGRMCPSRCARPRPPRICRRCRSPGNRTATWTSGVSRTFSGT